MENAIGEEEDSAGGDILILLDMSATFNTIDQKTLFDLNNYSFESRSNVIKWFKSYLRDLTKTVQIGSSTSEPVTLKYGVPQGSELGLILFTMYTTPRVNVIRCHGLDFNFSD